MPDIKTNSLTLFLDVNKQCESKRAELERAQKEEKEFDEARAKLSELADKDLAIFKTGMNLLDDVWKNTALDAREILSTLKTGEAAAISIRSFEPPFRTFSDNIQRSNFAVRLALDQANTMCTSPQGTTPFNIVQFI